MPTEEEASPSLAGHEESRYSLFQTDPDDSTMFASHFFAGVDQRRLAVVDELALREIIGDQQASSEAVEQAVDENYESYVDGLITPSSEATKAHSQQGGIFSTSGSSTLAGDAAKTLRTDPDFDLPERFE